MPDIERFIEALAAVEVEDREVAEDRAQRISEALEIYLAHREFDDSAPPSEVLKRLKTVKGTAEKLRKLLLEGSDPNFKLPKDSPILQADIAIRAAAELEAESRSDPENPPELFQAPDDESFGGFVVEDWGGEERIEALVGQVEFLIDATNRAARKEEYRKTSYAQRARHSADEPLNQLLRRLIEISGYGVRITVPWDGGDPGGPLMAYLQKCLKTIADKDPIVRHLSPNAFRNRIRRLEKSKIADPHEN